MLAPVSEADAQERALTRLALESARRWPAFAAELADVSGIDVGYRESGTLVLARDRDEAEGLSRELALRRQLGLAVRELLPSQARSLEPALAPGLRAALEIPGDHAVDPRLVAAALAVAAERAGVTLRPNAPVARLRTRDGRVSGVALEDGEEVLAAQVVIAAGPWSDALDGVPQDARVPVRPVKGQLLRLRDPDHEPRAPLLERVVRYEGGYIVPRGDGRYVLGATSEERGFDTSVTALALHQLLRDASELVPGVLELQVEELLAGLRPGTPDNAPVLGASSALPGLFWATGHHRNGVLLAPMTGEVLAAALGGEPGDGGREFSPDRFSEVTA